MSRFLALINRLKAQAGYNLLTDSQLKAWEAIDWLWQYPERVNLCGPPGSGKTFLAWVIAHGHSADFMPSPRVLNDRITLSHHRRLVVDNAPADASSLRNLLAAMQLHHVRTALIVTQHSNTLGLPVVTLRAPSTSDIDVVYRNLSLLEHYALSPLHEGDLWSVIHSVL